MKLLEQLQKMASDFRSNWNKDTHDWLMHESQLLFENMLIVCFCREYCVGTDQNAYSIVYVFHEDGQSSRIHYAKFWDGCPEWRDPREFLKTIKSAERNGDKVELVFVTEDGMTRKIGIVSKKEKPNESSPK